MASRVRFDSRILARGSHTLLFLTLATSFLCGGDSRSQIRSVAISPDGKLIAVDYGNGQASHIYKVPVDTGVATRLTNARTGNESAPAFSPDGKRIGGWPILSRISIMRLPHPSRVLCGRVGLGKREWHPEPFALLRCPLRLNFHGAFHSCRVVRETAPSPILRTLYKSASDRITMDVAQLLNAFRFAPHRKIVIANLPEPSLTGGLQLAGCDLLKHLNDERKFSALRFADKQMDVLRHDHVSGDERTVPAAHAF
jgi:WD40-like Beta Propeller Repeat